MVSKVTPHLTLVTVHAHPDDESTSTGGILAHYALEGIRTVVVTCTNGELGDGPGGVKPGQDSHDTKKVATIRLAELEKACRHLGVSDIELLGYHDSGMLDWDYKHRPNVFCNVPMESVAVRISAVFQRYRPQVVVTYDPDGTYQHPDHVHAARATALVSRDPVFVTTSCSRRVV
jgi:LmbE family N-acetylglucosaminyl deacetylase